MRRATYVTHNKLVLYIATVYQSAKKTSPKQWCSWFPTASFYLSKIVGDFKEAYHLDQQP